MNYVITGLIVILSGYFYLKFKKPKQESPNAGKIEELNEVLRKQENLTADERKKYDDAKKTYMDKFGKYIK
jgi:hypothetical protein